MTLFSDPLQRKDRGLIMVRILWTQNSNKGGSPMDHLVSTLAANPLNSNSVGHDQSSLYCVSKCTLHTCRYLCLIHELNYTQYMQDDNLGVGHVQVACLKYIRMVYLDPVSLGWAAGTNRARCRLCYSVCAAVHSLSLEPAWLLPAAQSVLLFIFGIDLCCQTKVEAYSKPFVHLLSPLNRMMPHNHMIVQIATHEQCAKKIYVN